MKRLVITPGPWKLDARSGCLAIYPASEHHNCLSGATGEDGFAIAYSDKGAELQKEGCFWTMDEETVARAAVFATAPELQASLKEVIDDLIGQESMPIPSGLYRKGLHAYRCSIGEEISFCTEKLDGFWFKIGSGDQLLLMNAFKMLEALEEICTEFADMKRVAISYEIYDRACSVIAKARQVAVEQTKLIANR